MATVTRTFLVDVLDGSVDDVHSESFSLDRKNYEIDMGAANAARLREKLSRFVDAATPVRPAPWAIRRQDRHVGHEQGADPRHP
jgi:hypothetical protein